MFCNVYQLEVVHKTLKATVFPDALENEKFVHSVVHRLAKPTKPGTVVLNSRDIGQMIECFVFTSKE